jgi:hypothetical protein
MGVIVNAFFLSAFCSLGCVALFSKNVNRNRGKLMERLDTLQELLGYTLLNLSILTQAMGLNKDVGRYKAEKALEDICIPLQSNGPVKMYSSAQLHPQEIQSESIYEKDRVLVDPRSFLDSLQVYGDALKENRLFLQRYGKLLGCQDALKSLAFHEDVYKNLFLSRGLDPEMGTFGISASVHRELLDKNGELLQSTSSFLQKISFWHLLQDCGRNFIDRVKSWMGLQDKVHELESTLTRIQERNLAASGLLRVSFTSQGWWSHVPFATLLGLTVLFPVVFNVTDRHVMNRANFGCYLSNNIRLAYEDFYYTFKAYPTMEPKEIYAMASYFLEILNKRNEGIPNLLLSDYGKKNRMLIVHFLFSLRIIALATLSYGRFPKDLPRPEDIHKIANTIKKFMEKNAWRSFLWPASMEKVQMVVPKEYKKMLSIIKSDKVLWSVFSQDCDKKCLDEIKAFLD